MRVEIVTMGGNTGLDIVNHKRYWREKPPQPYHPENEGGPTCPRKERTPTRH